MRDQNISVKEQYKALACPTELLPTPSPSPPTGLVREGSLSSAAPCARGSCRTTQGDFFQEHPGSFPNILKWSIVYTRYLLASCTGCCVLIKTSSSRSLQVPPSVSEQAGVLLLVLGRNKDLMFLGRMTSLCLWRSSSEGENDAKGAPRPGCGSACG